MSAPCFLYTQFSLLYLDATVMCNLAEPCAAGQRPSNKLMSVLGSRRFCEAEQEQLDEGNILMLAIQTDALQLASLR